MSRDIGMGRIPEEKTENISYAAMIGSAERYDLSTAPPPGCRQGQPQGSSCAHGGAARTVCVDQAAAFAE